MPLYRPKSGGSSRGSSRRSRVDNSTEKSGPLKKRREKKTIRTPLSKTKTSRSKRSYKPTKSKKLEPYIISDSQTYGVPSEN